MIYVQQFSQAVKQGFKIRVKWYKVLRCFGTCVRGVSFVHYVHMKILTTTQARKHIKNIVDRVKYRGEVFAIGRRNSIDALVINFPDAYNGDVDEITNINALSRSFDFLREEPELYSRVDVIKKYV